MAFFRNDAVNRINLHYGIQSFAVGAGGVFFLAYLLHAGISIPATLATQAAIIAGRFTLRPLILPLGKRWGLKPMVIMGALLTAGEYPVLAQVRGLGPWLLAYAAVSAVASTCYWPSFHAYFASLGDHGDRGHQVSAREALAGVVGVVAPLIGSWTLVTLGPGWLFYCVALVQAASAAPLLGAPNVSVPASAPEAYRAARLGMAFFVSDGWLAACAYFAWQVVLFGSLGRSFAAYGGAVALAALVGALAGLVLGRYVDLGHGRRATVVAYGLMALVTLLRAASLHSVWMAVSVNALGALVAALVVPVMASAVYNLAKASPDTFRFSIVSEGGWDLGCGSGLILAAIVAAIGGSLAVVILLAAPAVLVSAWLLWRYYGSHPDVAISGPIDSESALFLADAHPPP